MSASTKKVIDDSNLAYLWSKIKGLSGGGIRYAVCSTSASTATKEIAGDSIASASIQIVIVKFTHGSDGGSLKLKVGSDTAKKIYFTYYNNGAGGEYDTIPNGAILAEDTVTMVHYNNAFHILAISHRAEHAPFTSAYANNSTSTATQNKTITIYTPYIVQAGSMLTVKFTNAVGAGANIVIDGMGTYSIYYRGSAITADVIEAGDICQFVFNGTQFVLVSIDRIAGVVDGNNTNY